MYHHIKKLMFTVRDDAPDPRFGTILEQFEGANKVTGKMDVDLRSNIAAEARAKIDCTDDASTKESLQLLMTREITQMRAFLIALASLNLNKPELPIGQIPPTPGFAA